MNLRPDTETKKCSKCKVQLPIASYTNRLDAYCTVCKNAGRTCSTCREFLPLTSFYSKSRNCKACDKKRLSESKGKHNALRKERRHKLNEGKERKFRSSELTEEQKRERRRAHRKTYKYNKKMAGKLTVKTIQLVYEDNIKKYGTLTCYLCLKPIEMIKEHLEHKTPLSRGGTNDYENLGISCSRCNKRKHDKTVVEYLEYLNKLRS